MLGGQTEGRYTAYYILLYYTSYGTGGGISAVTSAHVCSIENYRPSAAEVCVVIFLTDSCE